MAKKTGSRKARVKRAPPKKKAKKKKPSPPAKKPKATTGKRGKKATSRKPVAKASTAVRRRRKAAKTSAAVRHFPSVVVGPTTPSVERHPPAIVDQRSQEDTVAPHRPDPLPTSTETAIGNMREGLAFIDQQRVVNNLDRNPWEEAPTPTNRIHEPTNARLVAHHAAQLEDELERGAAAIEAAEGARRQRVWMWHLGLARKPRAVVVGRALNELRATSWENASLGENYAIVNRINTRGPHHLNETLANLLRFHDSKASTNATAALATHVTPALELLQAFGWLKARTRGVYLDGDGLTLFVDFPDWAWVDEEPAKLRRIPGHQKPSSPT